MTHRFPIKEIARQAGVGTATVDRVLNGRDHVSPQSRLRVAAAIKELTAQEGQLAARGRRLFFDFVIEAPHRFAREVRTAAEAVLPHIGSAVCRLRFFTQDTIEDDDVVQMLNRIQKRGSHGVCLKARDRPKIRAAVDRLVAAGIPVVTHVTDIGGTARLTYVGLDNAGAGRTAAYLMARGLTGQAGTVLATRSHASFLGEEERYLAFIDRLVVIQPQLNVVLVDGISGAGHLAAQRLEDAVADLPDLCAVYSMGGGNLAILDALAQHNRRVGMYIGHDLDRDNRAMVSDHRIDFVLHHDLRVDMSNVFASFLGHHRIKAPLQQPISTVQIITPENVPPI